MNNLGRPRLNLTGQRFGRWTVLGCAGLDEWQHTLWRCLCDCGKEKILVAKVLKRGLSTSCGCFVKDHPSRLRHGHARKIGNSRTYISWQSMLERCRNEDHAAWPRYGGRGIAVCSRWASSFEAFLADMGERPNGRSIDRIDNDLGYHPGNCKWSTAKEQANNRRRRSKEICQKELAL